jgi:ATP-dependent exoDNAse (exonuclease V) alpha subunit
VPRARSEDKVVLIGDTRQHLGVDAGKPFEQLQEAGMRTAQLDQIIRQKDPELLRAVEHLSKSETALGIALLQQHGCSTQIVEPQQRFEAIAKSYASQPDGALIISPDNPSRREINQAVRGELQAHGLVSKEEQQYSVLVPRSEMRGADRGWATQYEIGDVLRYQRGSKELGLERGSYAQVVATEPAANLISVQKPNGDVVTYDPSRLRGIDAYRELERSFAVGDRIQMTAPCRDLELPNRALGTIEQIAHGEIAARMDKGNSVSIDPSEFRHFDHGYAVTSHSSQGLTTERVLVNMDTETHPELINTRFAYVSVSRASHSAEIFTNDASTLGERLSHDVTKTSATDHSKQKSPEESQVQRPATSPRTESGFELSL